MFALPAILSQRSESKLEKFGLLRVNLSDSSLSVGGDGLVDSWQNRAPNYTSELFYTQSQASFFSRSGDPLTSTYNGKIGVKFSGQNESLAKEDFIFSHLGSTGSTIIALIEPFNLSNNDFTVDQGFNATYQQAIRFVGSTAITVNDGTSFTTDWSTKTTFTSQTSYLAVARWDFVNAKREAIAVGDSGIISSLSKTTNVTEFNSTTIKYEFGRGGNEKVTLGGQSKDDQFDSRYWEGNFWRLLWYDDFISDANLIKIKDILVNEFGTVSNIQGT